MDLRLELLSALRAFRRVGRDDRLACRALGDEALRLAMIPPFRACGLEL